MADLVNILACILDSDHNFNGSVDPMITVDCGFIQFLGPDFGFWLLGRLDQGSQCSLGNLIFSFLCGGCHVVQKRTRNSDGLKQGLATFLLFFLVSRRFCFNTDVGREKISLIDILNAKTQYCAWQLPTEFTFYFAYHLMRQTILQIHI